MNPREYFIVNEGEAGWLKDPKTREFTQEQVMQSYWSLFAKPENLALREVVYEV